MRQYLFFTLVMVFGLAVGCCYSKLAIVDLWQKEHFELEANSTKGHKKQLGHIDYWVLHSFGREKCEGYIERLFVEKRARKHGLGSALFSHAISLLDVYSPSKTYLLAYPLGYKSGSPAFKTNMAKLLNFYERLGAFPCNADIAKEQSPFCEFDHEDAELVALRTAQALEVHDDYTTHLSQEETLGAAKIVIAFSATRTKAIGELRYVVTNKSPKKKVTGLMFSDKNLNQTMLDEVVEILIQEMKITRAAAKKMIITAQESDVLLPTLYEFSDGRFGGDELAIYGW